MNFEIQTYWNVDVLYSVFNAVASTMHGAGFSGLLKFVFLLGFFISLFVLVTRLYDLIMWLVQAALFTMLLNMPVATVILMDKTHIQPPKVVQNVPFALALIAHSSSVVFNFLTEQYETVFQMPDDLGLKKGDLAFGHRILKQVNSATITDPGLRSDLMQFIKECTIYDIRDGAVLTSDIVGGTDTWHALFSNTSPARFVTYNTLSGSLKTDTCQNVAAILKKKVDDAVVMAQTLYGKQLFPQAQSNALAQTLFMNAVGTSYDWILRSSQSASEAMRQAMFNNVWKDSGTSLPALLGDTARISEINTMAAAAQAAQQADGSHSAVALLAQESLPHIRNWIEAILYALFPVVIVFTVLTSPEGAKQIIKGYFMAIAWIGLWPLLFAVINHLSLMVLKYKVEALALSKGIPFQMMDVFNATLSDEQAMIGYMVIAVPFIAAGIVKLGQGGMLGLADRFISGQNMAASAAGSAMASGNVSIGQTGIDNAAVNTTSMYKYDSNIGLTGGGATLSAFNGDQRTIAPSGRESMQLMHSQYGGHSLATDHRYDAQRSRDIHDSHVVSQGEQSAYRQGSTSSISDTYGQDVSRGSTQQQGVRADTVERGEQGYSHRLSEGMGHIHGESSSFSMGTGANDSITGGVNFGVKSSTGGGQYNKREEQRIRQALKQSGASDDEIKDAVTNYQRTHGKGEGPMQYGISVGGSSAKNYSAQHSRNRSVDSKYSADEAADRSQSYGKSGSRSEHNEQTQQSAQTAHHGRQAVDSHFNEQTYSADISKRHDRGTSNRASASETRSHTYHHDYLSDPDFAMKVARYNNMRLSRFNSQPTEVRMAQMQEYLEMQDMVRAAKTIPAHSLDNERMPTSEQIKGFQIPRGVSSQSHAPAIEVPAERLKPLQVNTGLPQMVSDVKTNVTEQMDASNPGSISARGKDFKENVHAWASPDKAIGEGRANPLGVVEDIEIRDALDSVKKGINKIFRGSGSADGEVFTDNMRREEGNDMPISGVSSQVSRPPPPQSTAAATEPHKVSMESVQQDVQFKSLDKESGEGYANLMGAGKDGTLGYGKKLLNNPPRGSGSADREVFTDNIRRDEGNNIPPSSASNQASRPAPSQPTAAATGPRKLSTGSGQQQAQFKEPVVNPTKSSMQNTKNTPHHIGQKATDKPNTRMPEGPEGLKSDAEAQAKQKPGRDQTRKKKV